MGNSLRDAIAMAEAMNFPQCIAVVDTGGNLLAYVRMDRAKVLSQLSATQICESLIFMSCFSGISK